MLSPHESALLPSTTRFRSCDGRRRRCPEPVRRRPRARVARAGGPAAEAGSAVPQLEPLGRDRKSTRLNSSHSQISYAVFFLKIKNLTEHPTINVDDLDPQR